MVTISLARHAMATRFEIVLHGERPEALRAAGEEALDEIERLEGQLSLYRNSSEIAHLNARAAGECVRVSPPVFRLLEHAERLSAQTGGAFDITIGPLVRCWGFMGGTGAGQLPTPDAIAEARAKVGMHLLRLNPTDFTVRFARQGVMLDLGAIGKGYAIDRAVEILRDAGVASAILHGGTSTVYAIGRPPGADAWKVALEKPAEVVGDDSARLLAVVALENEALSVSAVWGRSFQTDDKTYGHVIDPRSGEPVNRALMAALVLPSATETDALSTALLTLGAAGLSSITNLRPGSRVLVLSRAASQKLHVETRGITLSEPSEARDPK
jgi:thiamine biosynthesis lipoprotein